VRRLLERDAKLRQLGGLARRGDGRLVLLRGEAGVGKTAVVTRFLDAVDPAVRVLQGWCEPLAAPRPLGPLIDALDGLDRRTAAGVADALEAGDTAGVYQRLLHVLGGGQRWLWLIEDAHWADGATLDLLRFLGRRISGLPLLLVVTYRDDEVGRRHPLAVAIGDVANCAAVTRIRLERLSRDAVAVLAAGSGVNADHLHRLTGGNPFYVTEVLAAGNDGLRDGGMPRNVAEAVWGRLARLSDNGRETAYAVAVCGPRTEPALVTNICGPAAALTECLDAGVLVNDEGVVGFRHELARRATLDQIPDHQRRLLHRQAMVALAEPPIAPDRLAALAFHADEAGDDDAAVRYGLGGAQRAAALGANREAAELYALVLRHAQAATADDKVVWLEGHAFARYLCGEADIAAAGWREAIEMRRSQGDRLGEGDGLRLLSHMLWGGMGRTGEAIAAARSSLRLLEDLGPTRQLAASLGQVVFMTAVSYDAACAQYAARAIALGTQIGEPGVVMRARCFVAMASVWAGGAGWDECETTFRAAMATKQLVEDVGLVGSAMCWTAALHHDLDRAQGYIDELAAYCDDDDFGAYQPMAVGARALVALHRGEWDRAIASAEEVLTRSRVGLVNCMLPMITEALVRARRGQKQVGPLPSGAPDDGGPSEFFFFGAAWAARAEIAWLAGDDDAAAAEAQRGLAAACPGADRWLTGRLQRWIYLVGGAVHEAASDGSATPYQLEISGDWQGATTEWTRRGCPYEAALAQLGGDVTALQSALDTFHRLGARPAAHRARQRLTALGGRKPRGAGSYRKRDPAGLTRREREVLELLAAGHSDAAIAAALHLSPKTVHHHVGSILAKLGVKNRGQATAHTFQQTLAAES
jgi:DNA-binding CsgD family transcriptional regulator/tetratricopeptide (TPR) repeat protein